MHAAFRRGGRAAIDKVMKQQPAIFLKLLVLLVPREMRVEHPGGVKAMTDEQIEQAIEAIQAMLAAREAGEQAKVIEAVPEPAALPAPNGPSPEAALEATLEPTKSIGLRRSPSTARPTWSAPTRCGCGTSCFAARLAGMRSRQVSRTSRTS
jgi:hypothetical protein